MLQLFNLDKVKIRGLKSYKDYSIESELSTADKTLSFLYPAKLSKDIIEESYIRTKKDEFVIKEIQHKGEWKSVKAVLNVEDLEGKIFESFDTTDKSITECLNLALAGTGWTIGTCDVNRIRTIRKTNSTSWDIIQEINEIYRVELDFDTINKRINIFEQRGSDKGGYFIESLNLRAIDIQSNSYDFYTRLIAIGKDDLRVTLENFQYSNKIKTFIWKDDNYTDINSLRQDAEAKLNELSKPYKAYSTDIIDLSNISEKYKNILSYGLGDTIYLISKDKEIKEKQRIVKITEYPEEPQRNTCEIANTILKFEDIQKKSKETSNTVDNITTNNGTVDGRAVNGIKTEQITDFEAGVGKIVDLEVVNARIEELYVEKANIGQLNAVIANVGELYATKANVTDLTAINADISNLKADTAEIDNLLAGNITANNIQAGTITAESGIIADATIGTAQIKDAEITVAKIQNVFVDSLVAQQGKFKDSHIENLSADKINAGTIKADRISASVIDAINLSVEGKITANKIDATNLKVENIDASKISTGTLDADRIGAGTISASKLTIGGSTNLVPNGQFKDFVVGQKAPGWVTVSNGVQSVEKVSDDKRSTKAMRVQGDATKTLDFIMVSNKIPCKKGDEFLIDYSTNSTVAPNHWFGLVGYDKNGVETEYLSIVANNESGLWKDMQGFKTVAKAETVYLLPWICINKVAGIFFFTNLSATKRTGTTEISNGAITTEKITANAITADKILAGEVKTNHLATNAVTADKVNTNAITTDKLAANSVTAEKIKAGSIDVDKITANAINSISVTAGDVIANKIASGEIKVGDANILTGTINGAKIAKATITSTEIANATITDANIKELNASKINAGTLDASKITVKNLNADSITTGSITVQGENLIHNTAWLKDTSKWIVSAGWSRDTTKMFEDAYTMKFSQAGNTTDKWNSIQSERIPCKKGDTFVFSGYFYTDNLAGLDSGGIQLEVDIYDSLTGGNRLSYPTLLAKPSDNGVWERKIFSITVTEDSAKSLFWRTHTFRNGEYWVAKPMVSRGSIASVWKPHTDELISNGAIDNDKIKDEAVGADKLNVSELFVGENAFIRSLKAVTIDASNITTGKISGERIDINGMISFEAFDKTLQPIFNVQSDKTYINGGMIATNTIKADKIDLLSGLTVQGSDGNNTFSIASTGEVEVNGLLKSGNFDESKNTGYKLSTDGTAILNQATVRGSVELPNAGMTNYGATIGNENLATGTTIIKNITGNNTANQTGRICYMSGETIWNKQITISFEYEASKGATGSFRVQTGTTHYAAVSPLINVATDSSKKIVSTYTFPLPANGINLTSFDYRLDSFVGSIKIFNFKVEFGDKSTPYCPSPNDQFDYTRIWAGTNYDKRDDAPFRVTQNGDLFATNATISGKMFGDIENEYVHIYKDSILINNTKTTLNEDGQMIAKQLKSESDNPYIKFSTIQSIINTDLILGSNSNKKIEFLNNNKQLNFYDMNFSLSSSANGLTNVEFNPDTGAFSGLNLIGTFGGGQHVLRHSSLASAAGTLLFDSEGSKAQDGDFKFIRKNGAEEVDVSVDGSFTVKTSIKSTTNNIEQRMKPDGIYFYAT